MVALNRYLSRSVMPLILIVAASACGGSSDSPPPDPPPPPPPQKIIDTQAKAHSFLLKSTFGPVQTDIEQLLELDAEAWIDNQFELNPSNHLQRLSQIYIEENIFNKELDDVFKRTLRFTDNWWHFAVNSDDQLR